MQSQSKKKYVDVDKCMMDTDENVRLAAMEAKLGYITLDCKSKKLSVCKQLSLHQQPMFTPGGRYNPVLAKAISKQQTQSSCSQNLCKM